MKKIIQLNFLFAVAIISMLYSCQAKSGNTTADDEEPAQTDTPDTTTLRYRALHGPTMQIDPTFPYYQNRSNESIAEEIELAGYKAVHYFVVNENEVNKGMIDAFHKLGMPVWLMVVGNGTYSTKGLPAGWESWKMKMTKAQNGGDFTYFSLFNKEFTAWKKQALVKLVKEYDFDGVEMAETYFPEWNAISTGRYGDVGAVAETAFKAQYGSEMPDFVNADAPNYYTKVQDIYRKWVQFRVEGVNDYQNEIYNGKGGVREARPDILVATWSLVVDAGPQSVEKIREDQGLDPVSLIALVKPDVHYFQTHWPDWIKPESQLPADYMKAYVKFTEPVKKTFPKVPFALQADQGSGRNMIKSAAWVEEFNKNVPRYGYTTWTTYEYHLGGYIYSGAPRPLKAIKLENGAVMISFNKRIDDHSGSQAVNYTFYRDSSKESVPVKKIKVDGNRAIIELDAPLQGNYTVGVDHVEDTPALRLYKDFPVNRMESEVKVDIH